MMKFCYNRHKNTGYESKNKHAINEQNFTKQEKNKKKDKFPLFGISLFENGCSFSPCLKSASNVFNKSKKENYVNMTIYNI